MKLKILAGLVTALFYGNAAMAQDVSDTDINKDQGQTSPDNIGGAGQDDTLILDQEDVAPVPDTGVQDEGVGGAGLEGQDAYGGSGQANQQNVQPKSSTIPMQGQNGMTLFCTPVQQGQATGGSGTTPQGNEQSSLQRDYDVQVGQVDDINNDAFGGSGYDMKEKDEGQQKADMRGLSVLVGAGVEGYTGGLAPEINPGPTVGVMAGLRPSKVFGLELGYSGSVNNLDADVGGSGPDIVRNGAVANVTLGLTAAPVQPYVLGGFGMNWYNIRNGQALGFTDDTSSRVPVGVGLRTHIGDFTADARVNYNILLNEDFAPAVTDRFTTGSYQGTLNLGGTF
ncbi:MAG TPA: hypothetical protein VFZ09_03280 [Archangium sp.]|uniref:hypothetical protein n=1 Tax=Archangium sp. TaxID=1872627 RepID=UPI002E31DE18|nr:hypothetical protein [Archangium sp.]HEX5745238.1 hypothetical protein [Archangium sp.]